VVDEQRARPRVRERGRQGGVVTEFMGQVDGPLAPPRGLLVLARLGGRRRPVEDVVATPGTSGMVGKSCGVDPGQVLERLQDALVGGSSAQRRHRVLHDTPDHLVPEAQPVLVVDEQAGGDGVVRPTRPVRDGRLQQGPLGTPGHGRDRLEDHPRFGRQVGRAVQDGLLDGRRQHVVRSRGQLHGEQGVPAGQRHDPFGPVDLPGGSHQVRDRHGPASNRLDRETMLLGTGAAGCRPDSDRQPAVGRTDFSLAGEAAGEAAGDFAGAGSACPWTRRAARGSGPQRRS